MLYVTVFYTATKRTPWDNNESSSSDAHGAQSYPREYFSHSKTICRKNRSVKVDTLHFIALESNGSKKNRVKLI